MWPEGYFLVRRAKSMARSVAPHWHCLIAGGSTWPVQAYEAQSCLSAWSPNNRLRQSRDPAMSIRAARQAWRMQFSISQRIEERERCSTHRLIGWWGSGRSPIGCSNQSAHTTERNSSVASVHRHAGVAAPRQTGRASVATNRRMHSPSIVPTSMSMCISFSMIWGVEARPRRGRRSPPWPRLFCSRGLARLFIGFDVKTPTEAIPKVGQRGGRLSERWPALIASYAFMTGPRSSTPRI